ncbi:hypothetical protein GH733_001017 [Mirounga leonina]|nr:hypothetical protein GH733_001017 [Mirounga leonina]
MGIPSALSAGRHRTRGHQIGKRGKYILFSMNETTALAICCRSEQKIWSPLVTEEGKRHPYKMNLASEPQLTFWHSACTAPRGVCTERPLDFSSDLCPQEVLHIGSAHNRSAVPFTASGASSSAPRVITNQYNNPAGLYSSENISSFNNALESKTAAAGQETDGGRA